MNAIASPSALLQPVASPVRAPDVSAAETFFVQLRGQLWHVEERSGWAGGVFVSLDAAVTFARRQAASPRTARVVILGEPATRSSAIDR